MQPARLVIAFLAFAWLVGIAIAGVDHHHGTDSQVSALPILGLESHGFGGVTRLVVECATDVRVEVGQDHGGSDLPEVTVWGRPKVGRCHPADATIGHGPDNGLPVDADGMYQTKFVDGATSKVLDLRDTKTVRG